MKISSLRVVAALGMVAAVAAGAHAQSLERVLTKYYEAMGGLEKWNELRTLSMQSTLFTPQGNLTTKRIVKRPGKVRLEMGMPGSFIIVQAYDGKKGWIINPMSGSSSAQEIPSEQAIMMRAEADIDGYLMNYKKEGTKITLGKQEKLNGKTQHVLNVKTSLNEDLVFYLDGATYMPTKVTKKVSQEGRIYQVDVYPGDFKKISGIMVAHSTETRIGPQLMGTMKVEKVEVNTEIPDTVFEKPINP